MREKKSKNVSVQISLFKVFDELSNTEYLQQFRNHPQQLAAQIDDLKTVLQFAASNYTQKARSIINLSRQFTKSIQGVVQGVNEIDMGLNQMPQLSFPEMAYEALKRGTSLELQEDGNQELDWRAVQTEFQLKFLESKNIEETLEWEKCYNPQQRCIQIIKSTNNKNQINGNMLLRYKQNTCLQIDLTLKMENGIIVWDIKKVVYQNNLHYNLMQFYKEDLMQWVRQQHPQSIQQSDKYVLSLVQKSLDYIDVILLFIQLKNAPFNQDIQDSDKKNGILNLFDPNEINYLSHFKSKNIKVCFLLPFSNLEPSIILRVDGLNVLKIEFTTDNQIQIKIKLKNKKQQMTLKKLIGSIKKTSFSLQNLLNVAEQLLQILQIYEKIVEEKVEQFKMDIFLSNRSTNLMLFFRNINAVLVEQEASENQKILDQIDNDLSKENIKFSGLYLIFTSQYFPQMPSIITFISCQTQLLFKTPIAESGFPNLALKNHPSMTFEEIMYHMHFFDIVEEAQQKSNWGMNLVYCDIYTVNEPIVYKFKLLSQKKVTGQPPILKKDLKADHSNPAKEYSMNIKISQNFKTIKFIYISSPLPERNENEIPERYFMQSWREYMKKRNDSQVLKNEYLDPYIMLKATYYICNHFQFTRYIKARSPITKMEEMVKLMDQ